ncbi:response regulator [Nitrincola sp. MINF-07-Sa-05]|uniref:response regulator n=1 Tax=Nitrincola salilacus TaxID=3400273 RepID=UPI00391817A8
MANPLPIVICDDSRLARRQMIRALQHWNVEITEAEHGLQALEAIRAQQGHLVFLDLNMPIMDGYEVLERIRRDDLPALVIVVSGDIQPDAQARVQALGAIGFIQKPVSVETLNQALSDYGLLGELEQRQDTTPAAPILSGATDLALPSETQQLCEYTQELANVSMGRAANLLAQLLNVFIELPIPRVKLISIAELDMALKNTSGNEPITTISQSFIGPGIAGEALLMFNDSSIPDIAQLLHHEGEITDAIERELLMDIANVLIGAFISSTGNQLDLNFSQGTPQILGLHCAPPDLQLEKPRWKKTLAIEIDYKIEGHAVSCDLLILFTEDSLSALAELLEHLE